jgi:hypothetical protein
MGYESNSSIRTIFRTELLYEILNAALRPGNPPLPSRIYF